ncbi:OmpA family protein [Variovorax sp. KK3]|uniref:OmpA family protein n=1 Tax=Variovorax sp. KK3 TaxID=1855728 RepID=UPI00097BA905|nr:OmpA family protein [Variovorax sp. KK3]
MNYDDDEPESDDGFGPGSDLVLSFLGVVLLLIGITAINGFPTAGQSQPREPEAPPIQQDLAGFQRRAQVAESAQQTAQARVRQLELDLQALQSAKALPAAASGRVLAFRLDGNNQIAFFTRRGSDLREPARQLLAGSMLAIGQKVLETGANHLELVGYASPEPSQTPGKDDNLDLSVARAEAVAHFLAQRGVPYECMSVSGFGRGRSEILYDMYLKKNPGTTRADWDAMLSGAKGGAFAQNIETLMLNERRVDIFVAKDSGSRCQAAQLQKALGI